MVRQPSVAAQNRPPLTRERIIEAALHIVDGQGLGRLTMRRLGDALQVEAMAIYHHMPRGKEELLDGLVSHVAVFPARPPAGEDWRRALREWATAYRARLTAHSGVLPLVVTRRNPAALSDTAASLREILRRAGLPEGAAADGAHALLGYVIGQTALELRGPSPGEPPTDWDARFTAGLELILTGLSSRARRP
ncbi:TetR/AcrR family transcriptional regulator [Thermomonospora catenispora]|uniref:TetR/AcrR family transcriptional regulator n=1 Tax=Thermomonospora catenispora TaxID=2493090 RepID=UPI00112067AA|nr:TetR/AcrR family transcriptional regulator C-terminal domain-containing protein [Thermomonospora catenispora]TNY36337.1 TetR family transcriptional regulator [Thermomonospora catenispora]